MARSGFLEHPAVQLKFDFFPKLSDSNLLMLLGKFCFEHKSLSLGSLFVYHSLTPLSTPPRDN
jgi:hypothetical protein